MTAISLRRAAIGSIAVGAIPAVTASIVIGPSPSPVSVNAKPADSAKKADEESVS
jgi:hypothetical protein